MTTEWSKWARDPDADPRFDLADEEVDRLSFLTAVMQDHVEHPPGGGVGAVRAFIDGQPVCVIILYEPNAEKPETVDMRPMAVLMSDYLFAMISPPPKEGE